MRIITSVTEMGNLTFCTYLKHTSLKNLLEHRTDVYCIHCLFGLNRRRKHTEKEVSTKVQHKLQRHLTGNTVNVSDFYCYCDRKCDLCWNHKVNQWLFSSLYIVEHVLFGALKSITVLGHLGEACFDKTWHMAKTSFNLRVSQLQKLKLGSIRTYSTR